MNDSLLNKADALMHRRSFLAGKKNTSQDTSCDATNPSENDIPVLTDRIDLSLHSAAGQQPAHSPSAQEVDTIIQAQVALLVKEKQELLSREIETWLDEQMPQLVIRAMDGITDHLIALLANRSRDDLLPRLEEVFKQGRNEDLPTNHAEN